MAKRAAQLGQSLLGEDVGHQAHSLVHVQGVAVGGDDPGRLLSAMLQRMQSEVGELFRLGMRVDGDDTTFFAKFVSSRHKAHAFVSFDNSAPGSRSTAELYSAHDQLRIRRESFASALS